MTFNKLALSLKGGKIFDVQNVIIFFVIFVTNPQNTVNKINLLFDISPASSWQVVVQLAASKKVPDWRNSQGLGARVEMHVLHKYK